MYSKNMRNT